MATIVPFRRQVPVELRIGARTFDLASIPEPGVAGGALEELALEQFVEAARRVVDEQARQITRRLDLLRLVAEHGEAIEPLASRDDAWGPIIRAVRERIGMSRAALATAIDRDPRTVARWEDGGRTRMTAWDIRQASEALGYGPAAFAVVLDYYRPAVLGAV